MDIKIIKVYFDFIESKIVEGGIFYNVNKYSKFINNKNINFFEYSYTDNWDCLSSGASFNQPNVHELIAKYNPVTKDKISLILRKIRKTNLKANMKHFYLTFFFIPKKMLLEILKMYIK